MNTPAQFQIIDYPLKLSTIFTAPRFVFTGNHEIDIVTASSNNGCCANKVFRSFDGGEMADHADSKLTRPALIDRFPARLKSIHVNAVMNADDRLRRKYLLGP